MLLPCDKLARVRLTEVFLNEEFTREHIDQRRQHEAGIALLCHKGSQRSVWNTLPVEAVITQPGDSLTGLFFVRNVP